MSQQFSEGTLALLERMRARDHDRVSELGRTKLLLHEGVRPLSVILFHGLSASPHQFVRFAHDLHERGYNVIVPRVPRHGHRDRLSEALGLLNADELRAFARMNVELAFGLGERVAVAGFSLGGLLSTWIAQRYPVERAIAIAPYFGLRFVPNGIMDRFTRFLLRIPNWYGWWDPLTRENQMPAHGYPRYSTHALAQMYELVREVLAAGDISATRLTFVTNTHEAGVNNRTVRQLAERLRAGAGDRVSHVVLRGLPISHDIIEPLRHPKVADSVYPQLLALIEGEAREAGDH